MCFKALCLGLVKYEGSKLRGVLGLLSGNFVSILLKTLNAKLSCVKNADFIINDAELPNVTQ